MNKLYIVWDEAYNLGIPIIDEQHRAIVSTINTYHYFVSINKSEAALKPTFLTLDQYTKTHFITEESIFQETGYPDEAEHIRLHEYLRKRMIEIAGEAIREKDPEVVLRFLKEWWLRHIREEDVKYASHVKRKL